MKIAIDIDNTILECKSKIFNLLVSVEKIVPTHQSTPKILNKDSEKKEDSKLVRKLFGKIGNPDYYSEIEGAGNTINNFCKEGHKVILLSSRPNIRTLNNIILDWLEKNNVNCDFVIVNCSDKASFCKNFGVDLLIDDSIGKCVSANEKGISTILFDSKKKVKKSNPKIANRENFYIANNWTEVEKLTKKVDKNLINSEINSMENVL